MRFLIPTLVLLFVASSTANTAEPGKVDAVIETARTKLFTARSEAIYLLEEAVLKSPQRTDYWIELLRTLETDSASPFVLRCYAQAAIKLNPDALPLRWEWLRLMEPEAALDELTELAKVEANLLILRDAREILELGLRLPRDWQQGDFYELWAARLVQEMKWDRVAQVVARGLKLKPESKPLRICEAMVLASENKYDAALAAIEKAGFQQSLEQQGVSGFPILSDILLAHDKPKLAVQAFGPNPSDELIRSRAGLILAQASLQAGDVERAEKYFEKADLKSRNLLVIANLLTLSKSDDARAIAEEMVDDWSWQGRQEARHTGTDMDRRGAWPLSLENKFLRATKWIYSEYPKAKDLRQNLTPPENLFAKSNTKPKVQPASEALAYFRKNTERLEKNFFEIDKRYAGHALHPLIRQFLVAQGNYAAAADDLRLEYAKEQRIEGLLSSLNQECEWSLYAGYARALPYFVEHPAELIAARQLLGNLKASRWNYPRIKDQAWLSDDEVVARALKADARILPLALEGLEPSTISGQDRTPWVQIIAAHGSRAEVPPLLSTLRIVTKELDAKENNVLEAQDATRDARTETAILQALEKLTGVKNPEDTRSARVEFWEAWWQKNCTAIVRGK